jgi:hypothetical protein
VTYSSGEQKNNVQCGHSDCVAQVGLGSLEQQSVENKLVIGTALFLVQCVGEYFGILRQTAVRVQYDEHFRPRVRNQVVSQLQFI